MPKEVRDLKAAPYNPRTITDHKLKMLGAAMKEYGDLSGIVINVRTGNLVGGHQRVKHLDPSWPVTREAHSDNVGTIAVGHIETPWGRWAYREVDWSERKELAANIAANKHGGFFDIPKLKDMIVEIDDGSVDLELTGFETAELDAMFGRGTTGEDGGGKAPTSKYQEQYGVIVICTDAAQQEKVYNELEAKGYQLRVVTT